MKCNRTVLQQLLLLLACVAMGACHFSPTSPSQSIPAAGDGNREAVIMLHGLGRSKVSMFVVEGFLRHNGYATFNLDYRSLKWSIQETAELAVDGFVETCRHQGFERIHFVTHSMGALVVRYYLQDHDLPHGSRIVMLAPPNSGSEMMDWARDHIRQFDRLAGPGAAELSTSADALHARLEPITPEVGVLMGDRSLNPFFSAILPGADDGKVSVKRARLPEMKDFMLLPVSHTTILIDAHARHQMICFLRQGRFCR